MSLVYIKDHAENINNVIAMPTDHVVVQEEMYEGRYYKSLATERKDPRKFKKCAFFGLPHIPRPDPHNYLKKHTYKLPMLAPEIMDPDFGHHRCLRCKRKGATPVTEEVLKEQNEKLSRWKPKYMIKRNIIHAKEMKPKIPDRVTIVDNKGTRKSLKPSLEPTFLPLEQFGSLPDYLAILAKAKEKNRLKKEQVADSFQPKCHYLIRDKRKALLDGLKQNWSDLQRLYSVLPILTDTIPKKHRKSTLEAELKQLEADIVLLERHPYIYVYPDDDLKP